MSLGAARRIAAAHPDATLPCPCCAATVKGANLDRHLTRTHPDTAARHEPALGRRLRIEGDQLVVRRRLLADTRADLRGPVVVGAARAKETGFDHTRGQTPPPVSEVGAGTYLRIGAVVVRCAQGGAVRTCWVGWQQGPRRRRWHASVDAAAFAALQYELADRGLLQVRT